MKQEILSTIQKVKDKGFTERRVCKLLQVSARRVRSWKVKEELEDRKPGPMKAPHSLLEEEREAIQAMAVDEEYVDDSHRILAVKASDEGLFQASASSVYRELRKNGLTTDRSGRSVRNGKSKKPERPELTGPNQRWCWDISYLPTLVKGIFLYLYVLLDEYSRKVIAWRVSWYLNHKEGMELIDDGLEKEGLDGGGVELPDLYNDRGVQMKAKSFKQMLKDLGMSQVFSRPRTPNDNPFVESAFAIIKGDPNYPGSFVDVMDAVIYFAPYFGWYNNEKYHGQIGYVTPDQKHRGLDKVIIAERERRKVEAREERMRINRERPQGNCPEILSIQRKMCSLIKSENGK